MKENRSLLNGLLTGAVLVAMVSSLSAESMDGSAKVVRVKGPARYMIPGDGWQPLRPGIILKAGSIVQTAKEAGSYVDVILYGSPAGDVQPVIFNPVSNAGGGGSGYNPTATQNVIRIWNDTALGFEKLTAMQTGSDVVTETQLDLKQGHITGTVKKMSAGSKYEIKLPNGVAGIRGTAYDITADGVVKVYEGSIVLAIVKTDANGNTSVETQDITAGKQYDARTNTLSDIPEAEMQKYREGVFIPKYSAAGQPTIVVQDHTIYSSMSTTQGQNGQGQNNNNQGQNNNSQ